MNLDNFSWIVLGLISANLLITSKLLGAIRGNKNDLMNQYKFSQELLRTITKTLQEHQNIAQSIKEGLIEIKSTVTQHQRDDKGEHTGLAARMKDLEGAVREISTLPARVDLLAASLKSGR